MAQDRSGTEKRNGKLGAFIRARRQSLGISAVNAAGRAGLDYSYWRRLEAGEYRMPSPLALDDVAKVIGCPSADLYALAGYKPTGELPTFKPYLRAKSHLPPEAIDQLESYYRFLRAQYGIDEDQPVFPPKSKDDRTKDDRTDDADRSAA